jgi:hypothetical protein
MGWYVYGVFPAGAMIVGAVAASGYGIAAWFTGLKMTRRLALSIIAQLLVSYVIAEYEEYRQWVPDGRMGFWAWFDAVTRAFAFSNKDGTPGDPFGVWGYAMRALEIGGFVWGGWAVPAALRAKPYCDRCRTYRRTKQIALIPGGFASDSGSDGFIAVYRAAAAADRGGFDKAILPYNPENYVANANTSSRISIAAVRCPRCAEGFLAATRLEGYGKRMQKFAMPQQPLTGDAMRTLLD